MKNGTDIPLTPDEAYQASKMFGSSLFSAIQLTKELEKYRDARQTKRDPHDNILRIPIPKDLMQPTKLGAWVGQATGKTFQDFIKNRLAKKQVSDGIAKSKNLFLTLAPRGGAVVKKADESMDPGVIGRALRFNKHPVRMLVGSQSGFKDAQRDYHEQERQQIARELMEAQKEYISTLQRIKMGEATPYVDAFCNGIAEHVVFEKEAADTAEDVNISDHAVRRMLGDVFNVAKKPLRPATDAAASGLLSTGVSAAYLTYLLRKKTREEPPAYLREAMPTQVELVPYGD